MWALESFFTSYFGLISVTLTSFQNLILWNQDSPKLVIIYIELKVAYKAWQIPVALWVLKRRALSVLWYFRRLGSSWCKIPRNQDCIVSGEDCITTPWEQSQHWQEPSLWGLTTCSSTCLACLFPQVGQEGCCVLSGFPLECWCLLQDLSFWAAAVAVPTGDGLPPAPEVSDVQGRDECPAAGQPMAEEDFSTL